MAPIEGGTLEDISGYFDLDSSDAADLIVLDECDGAFVVAKMSRQNLWHNRIHCTSWGKLLLPTLLL